MRRWKIGLGCLFVLGQLMSCFPQCYIESGFRRPRIVITREYIINPYWLNEEGRDDNVIIIRRWRVADSGEVDTNRIKKMVSFYARPYFKYNIVLDTCWKYYARIPFNGESFCWRKVYFNRYNGFKWEWTGCDSTRRKVYYVPKIGALELNTWYSFDGLRPYITYFCYVDSLGKVHVDRMSFYKWP